MYSQFMMHGQKNSKYMTNLRYQCIFLYATIKPSITRKAITYKSNNEARSHNQCYLKKQEVFRIQRMCVVFIIQYIMCIRHFTLLYVACLTVPYFPTFSYKRHDFRGKKVIKPK